MFLTSTVSQTEQAVTLSLPVQRNLLRVGSSEPREGPGWAPSVQTRTPRHRGLCPPHCPPRVRGSPGTCTQAAGFRAHTPSRPHCLRNSKGKKKKKHIHFDKVLSCRNGSQEIWGPRTQPLRSRRYFHSSLPFLHLRKQISLCF